MFVFAMMVMLFMLPTVAALDVRRRASRWPSGCSRALPVWVVPPAMMFLLFTIRSSDQNAVTPC